MQCITNRYYFYFILLTNILIQAVILLWYHKLKAKYFQSSIFIGYKDTILENYILCKDIYNFHKFEVLQSYNADTLSMRLCQGEIMMYYAKPDIRGAENKSVN